MSDVIIDGQSPGRLIQRLNKRIKYFVTVIKIEPAFMSFFLKLDFT